MDVTKEALIRKLLKEKKITEDDAIVLRREEKEIQFIPMPQPQKFKMPEPLPSYPAQPYPNYPLGNQDWIHGEMERRAKIAENCSCNPKNGGSGVCGCTLTGPVITSRATTTMNVQSLNSSNHQA